MDSFDNSLFYLCSLIEYLGRQTLNNRSTIVKKLGKENLAIVYEFANEYHCENIDEVSDRLIKKCKIRKGNFDNLANCQFRIPSEWDMGKVFSNLILKLGGNLIDRTYEVYNSWIEPKISNYNIAVYFMPTDYLYESYLEGELLD